MLFMQPRPHGARLLACLAHGFPKLFRGAAELPGPEGDFPVLVEPDMPVVLGVKLPGFRRLELHPGLLLTARALRARRGRRRGGIGLVIEVGHVGKSCSFVQPR